MQHYALRLSVSLVTFLLSLTVSNIPAFFHLQHAPSSQYEREVLAANDAYIDALIGRDVAALDNLLADEFTVSGYFGRGATKAQRLALVANPDVAFVAMNSSDIEQYFGQFFE